MNWQSPLLAALIATASSSVLVGLFQIYLNHRLAMSLEKWKTTLSSELFERQTKFVWLHTERAKAIVRAYRLLSAMNRAFTEMLRPIQSGDQKEKREQTAKAANAAFNFCERNRVFFDSDLSKKLTELEDEYRKVWATFSPHIEFPPSGKAWAEAWEKLGRDAEPLLIQVQAKVKKLLEVEPTERKNLIS